MRRDYFHRAHRSIDADNLSKPFIDALQQIVYADDSQILMRSATKVDMNGAFTVSTGTIPYVTYAELIDALADPRVSDFLLVEVGNLSVIDVRFGQE